MNTKDLSPAFITSLVAIFSGALLIGLSSTVLTVLGWLILIVALALNAFASMVSIQRAKGGPLPAMISERDHYERHRREIEHSDEEPDAENPHRRDSRFEKEPDIEAQRVISSSNRYATAHGKPNRSSSRSTEHLDDDEKIFRPRAPRPRNR